MDGDDAKVTEAYITLMINSAKAIRDYLDTDVTDSSIESEVKSMFEFERKLAEVWQIVLHRSNFVLFL